MDAVTIDFLRDIPQDEYWYLASPYSKYPAGLERAFQVVAAGAAVLIKNDIKVYSPIAHTHPIAIYGKMDPLDHKIWLPADEPFMRRAYGLLVYKMVTWEDSYGIGIEIKDFKEAGKPIVHLEHPLT